VVEEDPYLRELVRYLHLNPLRAKLTPTLRILDRFPWTGHSALLGTRPRPRQDTQTILAHFGPTRRRAMAAYRAFVAAALRRGREAYWGMSARSGAVPRPEASGDIRCHVR
jgi:hypothetical protein